MLTPGVNHDKHVALNLADAYYPMFPIVATLVLTLKYDAFENAGGILEIEATPFEGCTTFAFIPFKTIYNRIYPLLVCQPRSVMLPDGDARVTLRRRSLLLLLVEDALRH